MTSPMPQQPNLMTSPMPQQPNLMASPMPQQPNLMASPMTQQPNLMASPMTQQPNLMASPMTPQQSMMAGINTGAAPVRPTNASMMAAMPAANPALNSQTNYMRPAAQQPQQAVSGFAPNQMMNASAMQPAPPPSSNLMSAPTVPLATQAAPVMSMQPDLMSMTSNPQTMHTQQVNSHSVSSYKIFISSIHLV